MPLAPAVLPENGAPRSPAAASFAAPKRGDSNDIVFVTSGQEWDAASRIVIQEALALLPAHVRGNLGNPDLGPLYVHLNRAGRTLSGNQPYGGSANFYSTNERRNDLVLYPRQSLTTVLHELGHAFNLRNAPAAGYAQVLLDFEMRSFMTATGWRVLTPTDGLREMRDHTQATFAYSGRTVWSGLSRADPLEDFANSFALYFADSESLGQLSPARFAWFERHLGR